MVRKFRLCGSKLEEIFEFAINSKIAKLFKSIKIIAINVVAREVSVEYMHMFILYEVFISTFYYLNFLCVCFHRVFGWFSRYTNDYTQWSVYMIHDLIHGSVDTRMTILSGQYT